MNLKRSAMALPIAVAFFVYLAAAAWQAVLSALGLAKSPPSNGHVVILTANLEAASRWAADHPPQEKTKGG